MILRWLLAIDCGETEVVSGGEIVYLNVTTVYDSVVEYKCQYGLKLYGEQYRRCQFSGRWSGITPQCKRKILNRS